MNTTEDEMEFDYQEYMKDYVPDPDKIHRGPEARQNGEKQQSITIAVLCIETKEIMIVLSKSIPKH